MLTFRKANMAHAYTVLNDLSQISTIEVNSECGSWWAALPKVQLLLDLKDSQTEALVDEEGRALALFGHYPSRRSGRRNTWFIFSEAFTRRGFAAVRACRRRAETLHPEYNFHSATLSAHPDRDRWFRLLGFVYIGRAGDGTHRYIRPLPDKRRDQEPAPSYNPTNPQAS